jgi:OmpA-OmpF porin, OOP family
MRVCGAVLPIVAAAMLIAFPARADQPGWYLGAGGGWSTIDHIGTSDSSLNFTSNEGHGFGVMGFAGYDFGGLFRAEGEVGYSHHDVKALNIVNDGGLGASLGVGSLTGASANPSGSISALSFMMNGIVNLLPRWRVSPYIGIGVGGADVSLNSFRVANTTIADDSDLVPAGQAIAGIGGRISPHVSLALDYRYFITMDPTFKDTAGSTFRSTYREQSVLLSVTYHFGGPAPRASQPPPLPVVAPPPAPPPVTEPIPPAPQPRLFLVYFDFDKAVLTPAGADVVAQAAAAYRAGAASQLDVTGYTDLAGPAAYNLKLSRRRADVVRDHLIALGVPQNAIVEAARGKENPRVPTANGVREPKNRRVEIVLP